MGMEEMVEGQDSSPLVTILERMICNQRVKKRAAFSKDGFEYVLAERSLKRPRRSGSNQACLSKLARGIRLVCRPNS